MNLKRTLIIICTGIFFVAVGIVVLHQGNTLKKRCTEEAIGTVVEIIREVDSDDEPTYFPVIEYQARGSTISQKSRSGQNSPKYSENDQVEIYYNPDNVEEYIIKGDSTSNFLGILTIVVGAIVIVVGVFGKDS